MQKAIKISTVEWIMGSKILECADIESDKTKVIFAHCSKPLIDMMHNRSAIIDTDFNRGILKAMLEAHGFTEVIFMQDE